jgi:hypothetical protein
MIIASSCGVFLKTPQEKANYHITRAYKHFDKARQYDSTIALIKVDTVEVQVVVDSSRIDTVFVSKNLYDTVVIENERLRIKYVKLPNDTVFIEGVCKPDTVIVKVPTVTETTLQRESYKQIVKRVLKINEFYFWLIHSILGAIIGFFLYKKYDIKTIRGLINVIRKIF